MLLMLKSRLVLNYKAGFVVRTNLGCTVDDADVGRVGDGAQGDNVSKINCTGIALSRSFNLLIPMD